MDNEWNDLEPKAKGYAPRISAPVKFSYRKRAGQNIKNAKPRCKVVIRLDVSKQLIMPGQIGVEVGLPNCSVKIGKGMRAHQLAIQIDPAGKFPIKKVRNPWAAKHPNKVAEPVGLVVDIGNIESWPDIDLPVMDCSYKIERIAGMATLVIDLPKVLWANNPLRNAGVKDVR